MSVKSLTKAKLALVIPEITYLLKAGKRRIEIRTQHFRTKASQQCNKKYDNPQYFTNWGLYFLIASQGGANTLSSVWWNPLPQLSTPIQWSNLKMSTVWEQLVDKNWLQDLEAVQLNTCMWTYRNISRMHFATTELLLVLKVCFRICLKTDSLLICKLYITTWL